MPWTYTAPCLALSLHGPQTLLVVPGRVWGMTLLGSVSLECHSFWILQKFLDIQHNWPGSTSIFKISMSHHIFTFCHSRTWTLVGWCSILSLINTNILELKILPGKVFFYRSSCSQKSLGSRQVYSVSMLLFQHTSVVLSVDLQAQCLTSNGNWIIRKGSVYIQCIEPLLLWLSFLSCRLWPREVCFTYKLEQWSGFTCTRIPGNWGAAKVRQELRDILSTLVQHCMYNVYCIVLCPCTSLISRPSCHPMFITSLQCLYESWWMMVGLGMSLCQQLTCMHTCSSTGHTLCDVCSVVLL